MLAEEENDDQGEGLPKGLDVRDEIIMEGLMMGLSYVAIAANMGLDERTVRRRVDSPAFRNEHARRWSLRLSQTTDGLSALLAKATETLENLLDQAPLPVVARAVDLTFKWAGIYLRDMNQDARISRIEEFLRIGNEDDIDGETEDPQ